MEIIRAKKPRLSIDLAPLIDVVFQLLVFFMLTLTFANPAIKMVLPEATSGQVSAPEAVVVSIDKEGSLFINGTPTDMEHFRRDMARALKANKDSAIHVQGDKDMPYHYFVRVIDLARQAGARQINIIHQVPSP